MPYIYKSGLQFGINETNIHGGLNCVELTQAEYDELTYEQKHNGQVYFITDGNYDYIIVNDSVPIGAIQAYGGITAPDGWLICDGRAVSRTEYYELFKVIGVSYGTGDGTTTFNLPDLSVTNYIIKAKNPKVTKGQTDLFYPIGAYFETSDINFNPNEAWGGTWERETNYNKTLSYQAKPAHNFQATAANTWQCTGNTFVVPTNHYYIVKVRIGWSTGKPIGIGIDNSSVLDAAGYPDANIENANGLYEATFFLSSGTYYIYEKRGSVPTSANSSWLSYIDIDLSQISYKWHRTA